MTDATETEDLRTPHELLRDLYTALILDVHTVQRRLAQALYPGVDTVDALARRPVDDTLVRMETCIRRLDPLIDMVRELEEAAP